MAEKEMRPGTQPAGATASPAVHVFREIGPGSAQAGQPVGLDRVHGIAVQLSAVLGRTSLTTRDLLMLAPGTVLELDRPAGDPVDVLINDRPIAQGEVVTVNARRGIRLTDVVAAEDPAGKPG